MLLWTVLRDGVRILPRDRRVSKVHIWCFKCAVRCSMNPWKIFFVTGIRTSGQNSTRRRSSRRLKQPDFYALQSRPQELTSIILRRVCRMVRKVADQSTLTFTFSNDPTDVAPVWTRITAIRTKKGRSVKKLPLLASGSFGGRPPRFRGS